MDGHGRLPCRARRTAMTATMAPTTYGPPPQVTWDLVPPVAPYDRIAPTSAYFRPVPGKSVRSIEVTSSFINVAATLAVSTAVGWLAAVFGRQVQETQRV